MLANQITTVLVVPLTFNVALEAFAGNELIEPHPVGHVPGYVLSKIADGVRLVIGI